MHHIATDFLVVEFLLQKTPVLNIEQYSSVWEVMLVQLPNPNPKLPNMLYITKFCWGYLWKFV